MREIFFVKVETGLPEIGILDEEAKQKALEYCEKKYSDAIKCRARMDIKRRYK